ncbi:MAG: hypothetical protein Q4D93_02650 [Porphyromonas sp.]|nr:hypothetical protein [Porphyromonas sp.]
MFSNEAPTKNDGFQANKFKSEAFQKLKEANTEKTNQVVQLAEHRADQLGYDPNINSEEANNTNREIRLRASNRLKAEVTNELRKLANKYGVNINIHEDTSTINPDADTKAIEAIEAGAEVKGWMNPRTGEVNIYLPYTESISDAVKTYLHEVIGHKGVREVVGQENLNGFLESVYELMSEEERAEVDRYGNKYEGVEEFIAELAENGNFDTDQRARTLWDKIVELLAKVFTSLESKLDPQSATKLANRVLIESARMLESRANTEESNSKDEARFRLGQERELNDIKERAVANGTFMKAPNGKATNLSERQWLQVRTKAFKEWFGDWEKVARIEKLRNSEDPIITGDEIKPDDDIKVYKKNALEYGKKIRDFYTNKDTGAKIALTKSGIQEVLNHDYKDKEQLQSIAAIPQIIEKSIYIDTWDNEDKSKNPDVKSYHYYISGLKIGDVDYTARMVIAERNNGDQYYDHKLSSIEKKKLLDSLSLITTQGFSQEAENEAPLSHVKDTKLLSILKTDASKVVDENGEPMVVYHGTQNYDFNTFNGASFFTDDYMNADGYASGERIVHSYLSIKEPLIINAEGNKWDDIQSEYGNSTQKVVSNLINQNIYDGVVFNEINDSWTDDSDGEVSNVYVAFSPNQIKSATDNVGTFDSTNDDIRFRNGDRTLVGVHNISEEKLRKAIALGGLANPSLAVVDSDVRAHKGYGEISLIAPYSLIDLDTGENAGTWSADAWTPNYPEVKREMSNGDESYLKALDKLFHEQEDVELKEKVNQAWNRYINGSPSRELAYWYLKDTKRPFKEAVYDSGISDDVKRKYKDLDLDNRSLSDMSDIEHKKAIELIAEKKGKDLEFTQRYINSYRDMLEKLISDPNYEQRIGSYKKEIDEINKYGISNNLLSNVIKEISQAIEKDGKVHPDKTMLEAMKKVDEENLNADFNKWLSEKEKEFGVKEYLYNGTDRDGNQKWVPNTLKNASRIMRKEGLNGTGSMGGIGKIIATVANRMYSLDDIREQKHKLQGTLEEHEEFKEYWSDRIIQVLKEISDDNFIADDILIEALRTNNPKRYLAKEYDVDLSKEAVDTINEFIDAVKNNYPVGYFETKFERPVGLEEFESAIVPSNTSEDIKKHLSDIGLNVIEYDKNDEDTRKEAFVQAINSNDNIRFRRGLNKVNAQFNKELQEQIDGTQEAGHVYQLGMPSKILLSTGIPNLPIELKASKFLEKSSKKSHIYSISDIKDLPIALSNPLAVFKYGDKDKAQNIIVSIKSGGKNLLVGIHFNRESSGITVNSIRGLFPKDTAEWLNWITQDKALYLDKEKVLNQINQRRINLAEVEYLDLGLATKVVKEFDNPKPSIEYKDGKRISGDLFSYSERVAEEETEENNVFNTDVDELHYSKSGLDLSDNSEILFRKVHNPILREERIIKTANETASRLGVDIRFERAPESSKDDYRRSNRYNDTSDEVIININRATSPIDVNRTIVHEVVKNKGFRGVLGENNWDSYTAGLYSTLPSNVQEQIENVRVYPFR